MNDLKFAFRQLLKNKGFTTVAVLTLALGIGACTAIFSVVNSVLLRPLAYPESDRLIVINETHLPQFPQFSVAPGNYFEWREQATSFEQLAAVRSLDDSYNLTGTGEPVRLIAERITPNYLATLRMRPALGRGFSEDEAANKASVALLSHGCWLRRFGGRPEIVNETIQLNGQTFTIVGVLPENFDRGSRAEIFTPAAYTEDNQNRGGHYLWVIGRLKPGVTLEQARGELVLIAERLAKQYPDTNHGWSVRLTPLLESTVADVRPALYALLGTVGFLLLIACANVANLLLARATARAKEMSVRTALGASRGRIIRQLLSESVVLAVLGGTLGVIIAGPGMNAILALAPTDLPRLHEIALDGRALGFTCVITLLTGIGFGLVPAFQSLRVNPNETLKDGSRGTSEGGRGQRLRGGLVVGQVAIALVLLVGAGLLVRSFVGLLTVNPGFRPRDAFAVQLSLPGTKYTTDQQKNAFTEQALARLVSLPGVESVAAANLLPLFPDSLTLAFGVVGRPAPSLELGKLETAVYCSVTPEYLKAMGIRLVRGRAFTAADNAAAPRVALISELFAKKYFPGEDAVGQRLNLASGTVEVIGVVADVKNDQLDTDVRAQTYVPFAQVPFGSMTLVVRTTGPVHGLPTAIRTAIYAVDSSQPIASILPLPELVAASVARQRFAMFLITVFSGVALLLSAIGIYGVMAYSVTQRTREIGLRMALGAQRADVLRLVFAQGGRLVAFGLGAGLTGAVFLTRLLASMLFGVSAHDPLTFAAIALLLIVVAAFACWLPARRAARVNPLVALRTE